MNNHLYYDVSNLNAPYDFSSIQGLGAADPKYPWRTFSKDTQTLQIALNKEIKNLGLCSLLADGVLGPRTCGALARMDMFEGWPQVSTCEGAPEAAILPKEPPCPGDQASSTPSVPKSDVELKTKSSSISPMMIGLGVAALAIAGVLIFKGKKKGRR